MKCTVVGFTAKHVSIFINVSVHVLGNNMYSLPLGLTALYLSIRSNLSWYVLMESTLTLCNRITNAFPTCVSMSTCRNKMNSNIYF